MEHLSEQEKAVYDRQLRVWGVETQRKLSSSKVLILGCTGLAAEVAKNVVLAGVGSVTLADDTPAARAAPGNFLVPANAVPDQTVSEACVATLQEMNPFVKLASLGGSLAGALNRETLAQYDLVLLCGQPAGTVAAADRLCAEASAAFYAAACRGISGWVFANLHQHSYVLETKTGTGDGASAKVVKQCSATFAPWEDAMGCSLKGRNLRRANKLYFVLRVCAQLEAEQGRPVGAGDLLQLRELAQRLCQEQGLEPAAVDEQLLEAYATCPEEMPAVNAVVGGILANDLLKALSAKGEPLRNLFLYSISDGVGSVEPYGC